MPLLPTLEARKKRARTVLPILKKTYPQATCTLDHQDAFQLLVATILAAQCTDARVNLTTPALFRRWPSPRDFTQAPIEELEEAVRPTGFFRNKAKAIKAASEALVERHEGKVPRTMGELLELPGVGRKTANVILGESFDSPDGVVVDTHVTRVCWKLGLSDEKDAVKIERQLNECVPRKEWRAFGHLIIAHGRAICVARSPRCDQCPLYKHCEVRA